MFYVVIYDMYERCAYPLNAIFLLQKDELQVLLCQNHMCLCNSSCTKLFNFSCGHNSSEMVVIRLSVLELGISEFRERSRYELVPWIVCRA